MKTCSKCGHQRTQKDDPSIPSSICPSCKIVYAKYNNHPNTKKPNQKPKPKQTSLMDCPDCGEPVSKKAPTCPNCGTPISTPKQTTEDQPETLVEYTRQKDEQDRIKQHHLNKYQTSHWGHLFLSIITGGLWLIFWVIIAWNNAIHRNLIEQGKYSQSTSPFTIRNILIFSIFMIFFIAIFSIIYHSQ